MTQLVELQDALPRFEAAGIKLYAISYDEPEALAEFAHHHGITFPLLSDRGSRVIKRYGILNHFVTRNQVPHYGIPFPGTYLVDEHGIVTAKLFNRSLAARASAEAVIDSALGEILLREEEPTAQAGDDEIRISATYHGGGGRIKFGAMRQLVVRFELAPGLHIYDEPVPEGMVATRIEVEPPEGLRSLDWVKPPTHGLSLPGLDQELRVWDGRVDFVLPVHADDRIAGLVEDTGIEEVEIGIRIHYQACDERACRIPQQQSLKIAVPVGRVLGPNSIGGMQGADATPMDSLKFMQKLVRRGLLRSPVKGLRFMRQSIENMRRGPGGKRAG